MARDQVHYFGAGPALLPSEVIEQAASDFVCYKDNGIGLGEISHRSGDATAVINDAKSKIIKLLEIPDTHEVFFGQGGGSGGFAAVVMNLSAAYAARTHKKGKVDYFVTGSWSSKAANEAKRLGLEVNLVLDPKLVPRGGKKFGAIPPKSTWKFSDPKETAYVYYCDNETVDGVEFQTIPDVPEGVELVADMSSNFLSKQIDVSRFGLIFGGAQKNIGIAGVSLYIIKKSLLTSLPPAELIQLGIPVVPTFLDFQEIVKNNSAYNTVSIFAVRVVELNMDYLLAKGGLKVQEAQSDRKAEKLYEAIDKYPQLFKSPVEKDCRSRMNIVFNIVGDGAEEQFVKQASAKGLTGIKGHRSVGGIRISNCKYKSARPIAKL
jgi:phosphoserine aminotransferase